MQQGLSTMLSADAGVDFEVENLISPMEPGPSNLHPPKIDDKLAKATLQVLQTGRLTPLIKEELKCKIQARRHSLGQEDVTVEFKKPKTYSLTPEEVERVENRKERNRLAAQRFRQRRKSAAICLEQEVERLEEANKKLQQEYESLITEKESLLFALSNIRSPLQLPVMDEMR